MFRWTALYAVSSWRGRLRIKYKVTTGVQITTKKLNRTPVSYFQGGKRGKEKCSAHYLREVHLAEVVLDDLLRVTHLARQQEALFIQYINRKNNAETRQEIEQLQRELELMRRRGTELSILFKRLYEDNVLGKVTNEQFRMLSGDNNAEQKSLKERIPKTVERIEELQASI